MKYFKLFEDWSDESLNEKANSFAIKLINLSDGKLDGGAGSVKKGMRFKNIADWTYPEMEEFLKNHYDDVIPLKIGNGPYETHSGSGIYPGWFVTDRETDIRGKVLLAEIRGAGKHEDPVIQDVNNYFISRDESDLKTSESKTIIGKMKALLGDDLDGFQCASKDIEDRNSFANKWKRITMQLCKKELGVRSFKQDNYNPADIVIWRLSQGEEKSILSGSIRSSDNALRKLTQEGKIWPISLKAGGGKWEEYNISESAEKDFGKISRVRITDKTISVYGDGTEWIRISGQGKKNISYEVQIPGSNGQGGKCPAAWWRDNMLKKENLSIQKYFNNKYPQSKDEWIASFEKICKELKINFEDGAKGKRLFPDSLGEEGFKILLAQSKNDDSYSNIINMGTKAISAALMPTAKNDLEKGSPFYKLG